MGGTNSGIWRFKIWIEIWIGIQKSGWAAALTDYSQSKFYSKIWMS
jgi:hypothetical protein